MDELPARERVPKVNRILLVILLLLPASVLARDWIISTAGDDAKGDGTLAKPYRTVMRVLNTSNGTAKAGDTVMLRGPEGNNTYNECLVRLRVPLTLRSYPGEHAHIHCDPHAPESSVVVWLDASASGSHISDLDLSGSAYYGVKLDTNWYRGGGEKGTGASHVVLDHLKVHDTGRDGIKITPKSDYVTIRNSEISNTGKIYPPGTSEQAKNADGIDNVNGSHMVVEDCYIHDIATTGLYFKGGASDALVQRNRIENTGSGGIRVGFDTGEEYFDPSVNPKYYESIRGTVRNNFIRNTDSAGIGLYAAKDAVVANNTLVDTARKNQAAIFFGITFQDWDPKAGRPPSINPLIWNNLVIQNGGNCLEIRWSPDLGGLSALDGSPGTDWNGYYNSVGRCNFVDFRLPHPLVIGGSFAQWQRHSGVDAHSVETAFSVDDTGHLPDGSPAIDKGIALEQVTDDIDRQRRVAPYDIGADEKVETPAATKVDSSHSRKPH
ncbi:MAG: right-handed parallel beta-helix repeat-containing protein [Rhodanobacteraceae bacterium]